MGEKPLQEEDKRGKCCKCPSSLLGEFLGMVQGEATQTELSQCADLGKQNLERREAKVTRIGVAKYREDGVARKKLQVTAKEFLQSLRAAHVRKLTCWVKEQAEQSPEHTWLREIRFPNSQEQRASAMANMWADKEEILSLKNLFKR